MTLLWVHPPAKCGSDERRLFFFFAVGLVPLGVETLNSSDDLM